MRWVSSIRSFWLRNVFTCVGAPDSQSQFVLARRTLIDMNMGVDRLWNRNGVESRHPLAAATVRGVRAARLQPMLNRHSRPSPTWIAFAGSIFITCWPAGTSRLLRRLGSPRRSCPFRPRV
jgi:hypothetical protein